jgi:hypothetical protein
MRKRDEISNPASCLNRARPNEMIFVLLGRDVAAVETVRAWISSRIAKDKNTPDDLQIKEAEQWIETVLDDQATEPVGDEHCE